MDGLLALIHFLMLIENKKCEYIDDSIKKLSHYTRVKEDIVINLDIDCELLTTKIKNTLKITNNEKLIIRRSMWDPVIRVYYDYLENNKM